MCIVTCPKGAGIMRERETEKEACTRYKTKEQVGGKCMYNIYGLTFQVIPLVSPRQVVVVVVVS